MTKRVGWALLVGFVVGTVVWASVNSVPWWDPFGFWGLFFGGFAAVATSGFMLMLLGRRSRRLRSAGRWLTITVLMVFGLLLSFGPYGAVYHSPLSLEGMWLYPLGFTPLLLAGWQLLPPRWKRRRKRGLWDAPPVSREVTD